MKMPDLQKPFLVLAIVWFGGCAGLLTASLLTESYKPGLPADLYFAAVTFLSPVALIAFGWDKWKAERDGDRVPEKTLHLISLFGGWPGAVAGQRWFRHKTIKPVFRTILMLIMVLHVAGVLIYAFGSFASE